MGAPLFRSPLTDVRLLATGYKHWHPPGREQLIWMVSCTVLLVLSLRSDDFVTGALFRVSLIGGGFHYAGQGLRRAKEQHIEQVSWGCGLVLAVVIGFVALAVGGVVMQAFGAT